MRSRASARASRASGGASSRLRRLLSDDRGSAAVDWALVSGLLTLLYLTVLQLGFALYVRNVAIDAAAEGARHAGLAGSSLAAGEERAREILSTALSPDYAGGVTASQTSYLGRPAIEVRVVAPLPLLGLAGLPDALEVTGHAPLETL